MLPLVAIGLRVAGMRRVQALLADAAPRARGDAQDIARLVQAAASHGPFRTRCLATSLTLQWLLARHGIESRLRLGVRKVGPTLEAHAWLDYSGARRLRAGDAGFTPFDAAVEARARASR